MSDSSLPNDADREQLLAYLDGQLEAGARRQLEDRLATEKELRDELSLLQKCSDALAELGAAPVGDDFLRSTMTIVALQAVEEAQQAMVAVPVRRRARLAAGGAAALLAAAAGFWLVRALAGDPAEKLTTDLPVLEHLDEWRLVGSFDRLQAIHQANVFETPAANATTDENAAAGDDLVAVDIGRLSTEQQDDLLRRRQRLELLPAEEQAALRSLAATVAAAPHADGYLATLERYFDWAAAELSPAELDELRKTPAEQTPARIGELMAEHAERQRTRLSADDMRAVARWVETTVRKMAPNAKPPANDQQRRAELRRWLERNRTGGAVRLFQRLTPEDVEALASTLSAEPAQRLAELPRTQWPRVIGPWIQATLRAPGGAVSEQEMTAFFERLPTDERERLLRLPADEMQQQLARAYWKDRAAERAPPGPSDEEMRPRPRRPRGRPPMPPEGEPEPGRPPRRPGPPPERNL